MLNTLANSGHFPRDGKGITKELAYSVFDQILNMDSSASSIPIDGLFNAGMGRNGSMEVFDLDAINEHNQIEHDISLSRLDFYFGDPLKIDPELILRFKSYADQDGFIGVAEIAKYRYDRYYEAKVINPELVYGFKQQGVALGEAALFLSVFGGNDLKVGKSGIDDFLARERFPDEFMRPEKQITKFGLLALVLRLRLAGAR
jgi:hypothetical protein